MADGFEQAILGLTYDEPRRVIYSIAGMIEHLVQRDGMSHGEAHEYIGFNVLSARSAMTHPVTGETLPEPLYMNDLMVVAVVDAVIRKLAGETVLDAEVLE